MLCGLCSAGLTFAPAGMISSLSPDNKISQQLMISTSANAVSTRLFLGLVAGALSMLLFHQTTLQILYWVGAASNPAFRLSIVPPFNVPMIVSVTFWGAI